MHQHPGLDSFVTVQQAFLLAAKSSMVKNGVPARRYPFEPRPDDAERLWEVHEITQESNTQYKVRWAGTDPETGKPWAQSWVSKSDCTDKAVEEWEAKRRHVEQDGVVGEKSTPKRKRQSEADAVGLVGVVDEASMKTAKARPGKKQKHDERDEEDALIDATRFSAHSSLKVGPPRGVRKRHPTNSQRHCAGPPPAMGMSEGSAEATAKGRKGSANRLSEQRLSAPVGEVFTETAEVQFDKKQTQEVGEEEEEDPTDATNFNMYSSLKVGPLPGVLKGHSANSRRLSPGPSPAASSSGGSTDAAAKSGKGTANCPSEQKLSAPEKQPPCLSGSSDGGTLPKNWGTAAASARKLSGTSGEPNKVLDGYKIQFTKIAANILTLHGLVKKVDVQLSEAMKELSELEASFQ